jgi:hypothetical protein
MAGSTHALVVSGALSAEGCGAIGAQQKRPPRMMRRAKPTVLLFTSGHVFTA